MGFEIGFEVSIVGRAWDWTAIFHTDMRPVRGWPFVHRTAVHAAAITNCRCTGKPMSLFAEIREGPSPAVEELLEGYDTSSPTPPRGRERAVEAARATLFP